MYDTRTRAHVCHYPSAAHVKASIPPVEFYRVELPNMPAPKRTKGWTDGGLCPFHDDHCAGNFRVNLDSGAFTCFACGVRGHDIIVFVRLHRDLSFRDALAKLAEDWGIH